MNGNSDSLIFSRLLISFLFVVSKEPVLALSSSSSYLYRKAEFFVHVRKGVRFKSSQALGVEK